MGSSGVDRISEVLRQSGSIEVEKVLNSGQKLDPSLFVEFDQDLWDEYAEVNKKIKDLNRKTDIEVQIVKRDW